MATKDEALKMAIENLEFVYTGDDDIHTAYYLRKLKETIQACKEALEQPAQAITEGNQLSNLKVGSKPEKPLPPPAPKHICIYSKTMNQEYPRKCIHCGEVESIIQPAQEPVGYVTNSGLSAVFNLGVNLDDDTPLYTHPAPSWQGNKEFVGLSDDDIGRIMQETHEGFSPDHDSWRFAHAIEQALKEKNGKV